VGARRLLAPAESTLYDLNVKASRADWVANTHISFDTEEPTAEANPREAAGERRPRT